MRRCKEQSSKWTDHGSDTQPPRLRPPSSDEANRQTAQHSSKRVRAGDEAAVSAWQRKAVLDARDADVDHAVDQHALREPVQAENKQRTFDSRKSL